MWTIAIFLALISIESKPTQDWYLIMESWCTSGSHKSGHHTGWDADAGTINCTVFWKCDSPSIRSVFHDFDWGSIVFMCLCIPNLNVSQWGVSNSFVPSSDMCLTICLWNAVHRTPMRCCSCWDILKWSVPNHSFSVLRMCLECATAICSESG